MSVNLEIQLAWSQADAGADAVVGDLLGDALAPSMATVGALEGAVGLRLLPVSDVNTCSTSVFSIWYLALLSWTIDFSLSIRSPLRDVNLRMQTSMSPFVWLSCAIARLTSSCSTAFTSCAAL